jgi:hypothetical protein
MTINILVATTNIGGKVGQEMRRERNVLIDEKKEDQIYRSFQKPRIEPKPAKSD